VQNVRCEAKAAVRDRIKLGLVGVGLTDMVPDTVLEKKEDLARVRRISPILASTFEAYGASSISYDFEFKINEHDGTQASANFAMPFTNGNVSAGISGGLDKIRAGDRHFATVETFRDLAKLHCDKFAAPDKNIVYPMTGSVGIYKVMNTFISLTELGGGKGTFTDTLTFTTTVGGSVNPTLVLSAVPKSFNLVNANATLADTRTDVHQLIVSLVFPTADLRTARPDANAGLVLRATNLVAADTKARALEELCIAREESREVAAGTLRLYPPEVYCRPRLLPLPQ